MSTTKADILQSVSHGAYHLHQGDAGVPLPTGVFNILQERGFVKHSAEAVDAPAAPAAKMAAPVENKMDAAPDNKAVKTAKAK